MTVKMKEAKRIAECAETLQVPEGLLLQIESVYPNSSLTAETLVENPDFQFEMSDHILESLWDDVTPEFHSAEAEGVWTEHRKPFIDMNACLDYMVEAGEYIRFTFDGIAYYLHSGIPGLETILGERDSDAYWAAESSGFTKDAVEATKGFGYFTLEREYGDPTEYGFMTESRPTTMSSPRDLVTVPGFLAAMKTLIQLRIADTETPYETFALTSDLRPVGYAFEVKLYEKAVYSSARQQCGPKGEFGRFELIVPDVSIGRPGQIAILKYLEKGISEIDGVKMSMHDYIAGKKKGK